MTQKESKPRSERCVYLRCCYLAESLKCFGYKTDCVLYQQSNGEAHSEERFHEAMDKLINKTKAKFENLLV